MTRIIGYLRPISVNVDGNDEESVLRSAGATKVVIASASGDRRSDPVLSQLLNDLRSGDTLLVTRASRLAPNLSQFVSVAAAMHARGISLRSLAEPALSTGDDAYDVADVMVALDALRRELIGLRTRDGLATAARSGRRPGRPSVMTPDLTSMARELRAAGRTWSQTARVLGVSPSSVRRALLSPPDSR